MKLTQWWDREWVKLNLSTIIEQLDVINPQNNNNNNNKIANNILEFINSNISLDLKLSDIQKLYLNRKKLDIEKPLIKNISIMILKPFLEV